LEDKDGRLIAREVKDRNSPAFKAGLTEYDVFILSGTPLTAVTDRAALVAAMDNYAASGTGIFEYDYWQYWSPITD
jgi:hypothetical protein